MTLKHYYINKNQQESWDYEVHTDICSHPAEAKNQLPLWYHNDCKSAVTKAKKTYPNQKNDINWCYYCCNTCHTT